MTYSGQTITQQDLDKIQEEINSKLLELDSLTVNTETPTTNGTFLEVKSGLGEFTHSLTEAGIGEGWSPEIQDIRADINLLETNLEGMSVDYYKQSFNMPEAPIVEPIENSNEIAPSSSYTLEDLLKEQRTLSPGRSDEQIIGWLNIHNPELLENITYDPLPSIVEGAQVVSLSMNPLAGPGFAKSHIYLSRHRNMMIEKLYGYDMKASFAIIKAYEDTDPIENFQKFEIEFREIPGNKEIPIEEVQNQYDILVGEGHTARKYWEDYAIKLLQQGREVEANFIKNNPFAMAEIERLNNLEIGEALKSGQLLKYFNRSFQQVLPSMLGTQGSAALGYGGGKVTEKAITQFLNLFSPSKKIKTLKQLLTMAPYLMSAGATSKAGYHLEHASNLTNNLNLLINSQPVTDDEFKRINDEVKQEFTQWFDENKKLSSRTKGEKAMLIENMVKKYINDNYQINRETGKITTIPISEEEALDAVFYSAKSYASMASGVEMMDVLLALVTSKLPKGTGRYIKGFLGGPLKTKLFRNAVKKGEDIIKKVPFYNAMNKLPSKIKFNLTPPIIGAATRYGRTRAILWDITKIPKWGIAGTSKAMYEGMEEVIQSMIELRTDLYGPRKYHGLGGWAPETGPISMFSYGFGERLPELKIEKGKIWDDTFNFERHIAGPFVGGMIAGKAITTVQNVAIRTADHLNITNKINEWNIKQQLNESVTDKLIVKKTGPGEFKLFNAVSTLNKKTGKMDIQYTLVTGMKDTQSDGVIPEAFATNEEATQVAQLYNKIYKNKLEQRIVKQHEYLIGSEAKITKTNEDGTVIVSIISSEGNVARTYKYPNKSIASKQIKQINSNIDKVNTIYERHGEESINKSSTNVETSQENINDATQNLVTDPNDGLDYNAEAVSLPEDKEKNARINLKNIENAIEFINDEEKIAPSSAVEVIEKNEFQKKPNKVLSKNYAKILLKGYMVGLKNNTGKVIKTTKKEQIVLDTQLGNHLENADAILENAKNYPELFEELNIDAEAFIDNYREIFDGHYNIEDLNVLEEAILSPEEETQTEIFSPEELIDPNELQEFVTPTEEIIYEEDKVDLSQIVGEEEVVVEPTKSKEVVKKYGELISAETEIAKEVALEETEVTPEVKEVTKKKVAKEFIDKETGKLVKSVNVSLDTTDDIKFMANWKEELPKTARKMDINTLYSIRNRPGFGEEKIAVMNKIFNERVTPEEKAAPLTEEEIRIAQNMKILTTEEIEASKSDRMKEIEKEQKALKEKLKIRETKEDALTEEEYDKVDTKGTEAYKLHEEKIKLSKEYNRLDREWRTEKQGYNKMSLEELNKELERLKNLEPSEGGAANVESAILSVEDIIAKKKAPEVTTGEVTLTPGEVINYNGKEMIVRKVNDSGKVQMIDRETGKNFPGTPNVATAKAGVALEQLPTVMYNNYEYAIDGNSIFSLSTGKLITDGVIAQNILDELEEVAVEVKETEAPEVIEKEVTGDKPSILTNTEQSSKESWKWTKGQEKALKSINEIIKRPLSFEPDNQRIIRGYAGTGKTTIIDNIIQQAKDVGFQTNHIIISAPTNKALAVLRDKLIPVKVKYKVIKSWLKTQRNFATLHRLFYGAPDKETLQWTKAKAIRTFGPEDFIVIDEASMIDKKMYKEIQKKAISKGARVVFLGDGFQLPSIGGDPKILDKANVVLREVKRQGLKSNILKWATQLRNARKFIIPSKSSGDVKLHNNKEALQESFKIAIAAGKDAEYITFSNPKRISVNNFIRKYIHDDLKGIDLKDDKNIVIEGENLIGLLNNDSYSNSESFKAINPKYTGNKFSSKIYIAKNDPYTGDPLPAKPSYNEYTFYEIQHKLTNEEGIEGIVTTLFSPDLDKPSVGIDSFVKNLDPRYADRKTGKLRRDIGVATYGYAITGHKSQGSQWKDVYVDTESPQFLTNPLVTFKGPRKGQPKTAQEMAQAKELQMRWLYTVITRASKKLNVIASEETNGIEVQSWDKIGAGAAKASKDAQYQLKPERGLVGIQSQANKNKVTQLVEMLYGKFEGAIGYKIIDNPDLKTPSGHYKVAWYSPKENKVVINLAHADPTAPYHEYMHPFISEMRMLNKDLYDNLLKDIINTPTGKDLVYHIIDIYDVDGYSTDATSALNSLVYLTGGDVHALTGKEVYDTLVKNDSKDRKLSDEILAYSVSRRANDLQPSSNRFKEIVKKIIRWVRHKLFGPNWEANIYARSLDHDTTVDDLARLLANSNKRFTLERVDRGLLKEEFGFEPNNIYQYMLKKGDEVESAVKDKRIAWMKNFFNTAWDEIGTIGYTKKEDFARVMVGNDPVLPNSMHVAFDMWYRRKFKINKLPGKNREYTPPKSVLSKAIEIVNNNDDLIKLIDDKTFEDQRLVPSGDLLFIKGYNTYVTEVQRNSLIVRAKEKNQKFDDWKKYAVNYLKLPKTSIKWRDDAFRQYYNQLRSTARTNKASVALNGITNWTGTINSNNEFELEVKGPENKFTKKQNPQIQKRTLADYYFDINFDWITVKDVMRVKQPTDELGAEIFGAPPIYNTIYGGFNKLELNNLNIALLKLAQPKTIAFSRGDNPKYALTNVTKEHTAKVKTKKNMFNYLQKEINNGYITKPQARQINKEMHIRPIIVNAAWIASHEAKKSVYPRYMLDKKGLPNVIKRAKIMFTPVTVNDEGPDIRSVAFNPRQVDFVTELGVFSPMKRVPNMGKKYIGDGETIGSSRHFSMSSRYHGFSNKASVMKTVQYLKDGDNVFAKKHQVFRTDPDWKIAKKDSEGKEVLFIIDSKANVNYGPAHPNYREGKDNYIDELATSDEIKIGLEKFDKNNPKETYDGIFALGNGEIKVPSGAIGFIKYEDKPVKDAKHPQQIYNYIDNPEIIELFKENYGIKADNEVRDALRHAITLTGGKPNVEKIAKLLEKIDGSGVDDYIPMALEHMRNGSGRHLTNAKIVDEIVQNKLVKPALQLEGYNGNTLNVAMDNKGLLKEGEIGIPRSQAKFILEQYEKDTGEMNVSYDDITTEEVNEWLDESFETRERGTYLFVTRFPVPHEGGSYMGRVKYLHDRMGVAILHVNDVLIKLEADNDGDHVEVELLPNSQMTRVYKEHFDGLDVKPIVLQNYVNEKDKIIATNQDKLFDTISELITGETAIGEISNVAAVYGSLRLVWEKFNVNYRDIYLRDKNEYISFGVWHKKSATGGKIRVDRYLRTFLQAALDNAEYGLLGKWNYSQDNLYKSLFKYKDGKEINNRDYKMLDPLLKLHKMANQIRNGRTFKDGNFSLAEIIVKSREYLAYTEGRLSTLQFDFGIIGTLKNNDMTPIEYIATAPARMFNEMSLKNNLFGFKDSPYIISKDLHQNAHIQAMEEMKIEHEMKDLDKAVEADGKTDKDKSYIKKELKKGEEYANSLGTTYYNIVKNPEELGPQAWTRNPELKSFMEDFWVEFNGLSNVAKFNATYHFLDGYKNLDTGEKGSHYAYNMVPTSNKKYQPTMLDHKLVNKYYKIYNNYVNTATNILSDNRSTPRGITDLINRYC